MSIIVTGGAGFIGSCVVRSLNDRGIEDIIVVDNIASTEKWRNLCNQFVKKLWTGECANGGDALCERRFHRRTG